MFRVGFTALAVSFALSLSAVDVGTVPEFAAALGGSDPVVLTSDLDLSGWTSVDVAGPLTVDGDGHRITGLTVPLFATFTGTVKNLTLDGAVGGENTAVALPNRTDFALLALTTSATRVENTYVRGYTISNRQPSDRTLPQNAIGFVVACAYDGCVFDHVVTMEGCAATMGGDLAFGGLVGNVKRTADFAGGDVVTFTACVNNATITTVAGCSAAGNGSVGGILGRDSIGSDATKPCTLVFTDCVNNGNWNGSGTSGNAAVGGMIGQYAGGTTSTAYNTLKLTGCSNHGNMSTATSTSCNNMRLGGMIGMAGRYVDNMEFDKCLNDGNIHVPPTGVGGNTHGGFIGYAYDFSKNAHLIVRNSVNRGNIHVAVSATQTNQAGGLIGLATFYAKFNGVSFTVENCSFGGEMTAKIANPFIAQFGTSTTIHSSLTLAVDNCWISMPCDLIDTKSYLGANYSEANVQYHVEGADAKENAALALVAAAAEGYATWQVNSKSGHPEPVLGATLYTVVFIDYDGSLISMQQVEEGQAATAPGNPSRTGYAFVGWSPADFSHVTDNMTIVASYEQSADYRTVTFVDYDGRELEQVAIESGTSVDDKGPHPNRTGYTHVGWTLQGQPYDLTQAVTADIALVAAYEINVYDVVFFDWNSNPLGETQKVPYLEAAVAPPLPALPEGKAFWKWSADFSSVTADLAVYARICDREQTIGSAAEFLEKINSESPAVARYTLTDDIVLVGWTGTDFSSSIDGQGHVISGLAVPLFNAVKGATIANLVIADSALNTVSQDECIGLVARTAADGTVISNVTTTADCSIGAGINVVAGGLVGLMQNAATYTGEIGSWIVDCTNRATVAKTSTDSNSRGSLAGIVGRIEAQGLAGQPFVTNGILRCANYGPITCSFNGGRIAGLVGRIYTQNDKALVAVLDSGNYTNIVGETQHGSDAYKKLFAGGLVAAITAMNCDALIDGCVNRGNVSVGFEPEGQADNLDKTAGGLIAHIDSLNKNATLSVRNSANYGNVTGENAAGVIATFGAGSNFSYTKGRIENCASYGTVTGKTSKALAVAKWTKPTVNFTRLLKNSFFLAEYAQELLVVGGSEEGFDQNDVVTSADPYYTVEVGRRALDAVAVENGWMRWRISPLGEGSAPQLVRFALTKQPFVITIR